MVFGIEGVVVVVVVVVLAGPLRAAYFLLITYTIPLKQQQQIIKYF